jgi:prepilin-type N-terminal cleavage/methylation domain-containing protein
MIRRVAFMQWHPPGAIQRRAIGVHGRLDDRGLTLIEVLFALAVTATATTLSMSLVGQTIDAVRTASAARYIASKITAARAAAVRGTQSTALRFEAVGGDYRFGVFADGNGNGVRAAEIRDGTDPCIEGFERLSDKFPGVRFALTEGLPDADGQPLTGTDGVRIGAARILTMSSDGTATSGTLYIRGRRVQFAVRVLGVTGRTRMLEYRPGNDAWINR